MYRVLFTALCFSVFLPGSFQSSYKKSVPHFPTFNCEKPGIFPHPDRCSAYVKCTEDLEAIEEECPECTGESCDGAPRLHFNAISRTCSTPSEAKCPPRDECDIGCFQVGFCDCYDTCEPDNSSSTGGTWVRGRYCDLGLFWNPHYYPHYHGGSCDFWENLSEETQEMYRLDEDCGTPPLECYWEADPKCDNKYFYMPPNSKNIHNLVHLTCPTSPEGQSLYWNQENLSCSQNCTSKSVVEECTVCD